MSSWQHAHGLQENLELAPDKLVMHYFSQQRNKTPMDTVTTIMDVAIGLML